MTLLGSEPWVRYVEKRISTFHPSRASWIPKLIETDLNQHGQNSVTCKREISYQPRFVALWGAGG